MIDIIAFLALLCILMVGLLVFPLFSSLLLGWPQIIQPVILSAVGLVAYHLGMYNLRQRSSAMRRWSRSAGLMWPGHLGLPALIVVLSVVVLRQQQVNAVLLAGLWLIGYSIVWSFFFSQRQRLASFNTAVDLQVSPQPDRIELQWEANALGDSVESIVTRVLADQVVPSSPQAGYIIYRGLTSKAVDMNPMPGKHYLYVVFLDDGYGRLRSTAGKIAGLPPLPEPPLFLTVEPYLTSIILRWQIINPHLVQRIRVKRFVAGMQVAETFNMDVCEEWSDTNLEGATRYRYEVYALDHRSEETFRGAVPATIDTATNASPLVATAKLLQRRNVALSWQAPNHPDFLGVTIVRMRRDIPGKQSTPFKVDGDQWLDENLKWDIPFYYELTPLYKSPIKAQSVILDCATGKPPLDVLNLGYKRPVERNQITLQWQLPTNEAVDAVIIKRSPPSELPRSDTRVWEIKPPITQALDSGLAPGKIYTYDVRLRMDDGTESEGAMEQGATAGPPAEVYSATARYDAALRMATLEWQLSDRDPTIVGTRVVRRKGQPAQTLENGMQVYEGDLVTCTDRLDLNEYYFYTFFTYDAEKNYSNGVWIAPVSTYQKVRIQLEIVLPPQRKQGSVHLPGDKTMQDVIDRIDELIEAFGLSKSYTVFGWDAVRVSRNRGSSTEESLSLSRSLYDLRVGKDQHIILRPRP